VPKGDAEAKRRQRARNKQTGHQAAGSSMVTAIADSMMRVEFDEIEDIAEHVVDLQALFQSGQIMANRSITGTLVASKEWAHEMVDAALASQGHAVFVRIYRIPLDAVLPEPEMDSDDPE
jgi:hypothetical protein